MPVYTDDGKEFHPDLYPKPALCLSCRKDENQEEEILCNMNRSDQLGESEFRCFAYENKYK